MVDGFPYKEEVGGSSPSVPTILAFDRLQFVAQLRNDKLKFVGLLKSSHAES